jgi:hypothetical protein
MGLLLLEFMWSITCRCEQQQLQQTMQRGGGV